MSTPTGSIRNDVPNVINSTPSAVANMPKDGLPIMHQSLPSCLPPGMTIQGLKQTLGRIQPILPWPDIGRIAKWSVSSYKFGFGAECLRDGDPDTFWQPDYRAAQKLSIYLSWPLDDSYTPSTLAIRAGTGPSDLQDVRVASLDKPDGWITFDVSSELSEDGTT
ncbi:galactose-binding domain-like protein [Butyriboletus roseoflavus]|nr:galactose-binding domain-like protein [Butyriboletus roseoflavus]